MPLCVSTEVEQPSEVAAAADVVHCASGAIVWLELSGSWSMAMAVVGLATVRGVRRAQIVDSYMLAADIGD